MKQHTAGTKSERTFHTCTDVVIDKSSSHDIVLVRPKRQIAVAGLLVNTWTVMKNPLTSGVLSEKQTLSGPDTFLEGSDEIEIT